jgi:hypothetical protein
VEFSAIDERLEAVKPETGEPQSVCAPKFPRSLGRSSAGKWVYDLFQRVPRDHPVVVKVLDPIHLIREPKINERNTLLTAETARAPPEDELGLARFDVFPGLAADVDRSRITAASGRKQAARKTRNSPFHSIGGT